MKPKATTTLRAAVYLTGLAVLSICFILLPELAREQLVQNPDAVTYPYLVGAYVLIIPIFIALYQTLKLASYIDKGESFSLSSVTALRSIKYCVSIFGVMILIGALAIIGLARNDNPTEDVTRIVALGFIFTFASVVVATATAVLQRLLQNAVDIKLENDLTV